MDDSNDELYAQVVAVLDGEDTAWIKRAHRTGILRGRELLALILLAFRDLTDPTLDPKKIIRDWSPQLMRYVKENDFVARDPHSLFHMDLKTVDEWDWVTAFIYADRFFDIHGMGLICSELVDDLFNSCRGEEQTTTPEQNEEMATRRTENSELRRKLGALKKKLDSAGEIITGFAITHYEYDPTTDERNMQLSKMEADLEKAHFPQDDKTIRQFLKRKSTPEK